MKKSLVFAAMLARSNLLLEEKKPLKSGFFITHHLLRLFSDSIAR